MIAAIAGLAILGGFIQTITGFGAGTVLMAVFPYFFSITQAPALSSSICWGLNLMLTWQYRKFIDLKKLLLPGLLYIVFALLSVQVVGRLNYDAVTIAFGAFCILLALYFLFFAKKLQFKPTTGAAVLCSTVSGICSGLFGIGGPLMGVYYVSVTDRREEYIASLQSIFAVNGLTILTMRLVKGYYTTDMIPLTLAGITGIFIGKLFGTRIADKLDGDTFKKVVYLFVGISGVVTIIETLL